MTNQTSPFAVGRHGASPAALAASATALLLLVAAIAVGQVSRPGFLVIGGMLVILLAAGAWRWPRVVLLIVVLSPILDRYILAGLLPSSLGMAARVSSEALLAGVALVIAVRGWRDGTLRPALRHRTVAALAIFVVVAAVGTLVNAVPPVVAGAGLAFTVDAAILLVAVRVVGYDLRQAWISVLAFIALVTVAALVALLQALLDPNLFGLYTLQGRFGEVYRLSSFLGDPNTFGAFLVAAIPFALMATVTARPRRWRAAALGLSLLLLVALWISFSRGAWLAFLVGGGIASLLIDRRVLVIGATLAALAFAIALLMPRDLLVPPPDPNGGGGDRPDLVDSTLGRFGAVGEGRDLRAQFVINAIPILLDHPAVGVGPGRYGGAAADIFPTPVYAAYDTDQFFSNPAQRTVDNFWLHILVEGGVMGTVALVAAVLAAAWPALLAARRTVGPRRILLAGIAGATATLAVNAVSTMTLEGNSVGYLFWFLLGLGTLVLGAREQVPDPEPSAGEQEAQQAQPG